MPLANPYLIIAQSGRSLAASAKKAGIQTHVIDRFGDIDTKDYALSTRIVNGNKSGICVKHLRTLLAEINPDEIKGVITGSGFENQPEILDELDEKFNLLGNKTECVKACKDPSLFFPVMESHGISYPEISFDLINDQEGWLVKKAGGNGGQHIYWADGNKLPDGHYYQKFIKGKNISITFVANGQEARIVGNNETWVQDSNERGFRHHGAVTALNLSQYIKNQLQYIISKLAKELHLVGICGLDVVIDRDGGCHVLEINPRPVSTIDLYEQQNLFLAHIKSCEGQLINLGNKNNICGGYQIYYSANEFNMPDIKWPDWVVDRPQHGEWIASGTPICTIRAVADTPFNTRKLLDKRKLKLSKLFTIKKVAA